MTMFQTLHRSMAPSQTLKIQCEVCRHLANLAATDARTMFGPDATPADIRRPAKCKVCGASARVRVWI